MKVYKLWDSAQFDKFTLPPVFSPAPHKFTGTPIENLCELAGRVCYDSIDGEKGKDSKHYHEHIREVKHDSIYGHVVLNFMVNHGAYYDDWKSPYFVLLNLANRPGVFITSSDQASTTFAVSMRAALQWDGATSSGEGSWKHGVELWDEEMHPHDRELNSSIRRDLRSIVIGAFNEVAPAVFDGVEYTKPFKLYRVDNDFNDYQLRWMSVYIEGVSRDLLQELVRHHYQTAPSVRSTRYCDESCSNFIAHPALDDETRVLAEEAAGQSRAAYSKIFAALKGKNTPLKVARGAARCVLPGGTETKLVYSASVKQWQWLASMRVHSAADLEIQNLAKECVKQLELN